MVLEITALYGGLLVVAFALTSLSVGLYRERWSVPCEQQCHVWHRWGGKTAKSPFVSASFSSQYAHVHGKVSCAQGPSLSHMSTPFTRSA